MVTNGPPGVEKEELEKEKLQTEIEEIKLKIKQGKSRLDFERKDASKEHIRSWAAIIISIVTIAVGGATIGEKVNTFFSQSAQTERAKINTDMINLVKGLKSNDKGERENAALLLSAYEMEAVPVLLKHLEFINNPESIIESLKLIRDRRGVSRKDFLTELLEKAKTIFKQNLDKLPTVNEEITPQEDKAGKCIANFITALGEVFGDRHKDWPKIETLFQGWEQEIKSRPRPIEEDTKNGLIIRLGLERKKHDLAK